MDPYVICQGDYVAKLAYAFDFDADAVWNDPKNAELRQARPNPNVLLPTDVLYIPPQAGKTTTPQSLTVGATNTFVSTPPTVTVTIRFLDAPLASQAYSVPELPDLVAQTTGQDGTATLVIPVSLERFTILFTESETSFSFDTGHLDPVDAITGVFQRLQSLGYIAADATVDPPDLEMIRMALRVFKAASLDNGSDLSEFSETDSEDAPAPDNAGLTDEGVLDDATAKILIAAHGI